MATGVDGTGIVRRLGLPGKVGPKLGVDRQKPRDGQIGGRKSRRVLTIPLKAAKVAELTGRRGHKPPPVKAP